MSFSPTRTVLILLASSAAAACATATPNFPISQDSPAVQPPPPAPAVAQPPPLARAEPEAEPAAPLARAPVETRPLDPPAPQPPAPPPPRAEPREPIYRTVTTRSVTGRVVDVDGPARTYTVKRGDNLARVAAQLGTTVERLARDNDLKKPYVIHPGDVLKGPASAAKAYVVTSGDTLSAISRRFSVSVDALRSENDLSGDAIRPGQHLRLPSGYRDGGPLTATTRVAVEDGAPAAEPLRRVSSRAPEPEADEAPPPPPRASPATTTTRSVTGRVVDVEGPPRTYTVRKGDNLTEIARRLDTSIEQLARDNKLSRPYRINPGQTLRGPRTTAKAYVVGEGDTLGEIAQRFSVSVAALRRANGLSRSGDVAPGRRLRLPAGYRDRGPIVTSTRVAEAAPPARTPPPRTEPTPALPSAPQPYTGTPRPPPRQAAAPRAYTPPPGGVPGAPVATPLPSDAQITQMGRGVFIWPVRGEVISDFGPKSTGQRNDGVNIRAQAGEPVRAAADGDVVYAGDQVPGFGNLVLIKHADGWVTAYGHLSRVDVRMQQKVTQGQQIGQAGATGGVSEPQLHFEVRYAANPQERARPVDPALVLPR